MNCGYSMCTTKEKKRATSIASHRCFQETGHYDFLEEIHINFKCKVDSCQYPLNNNSTEHNNHTQQLFVISIKVTELCSWHCHMIVLACAERKCKQSKYLVSIIKQCCIVLYCIPWNHYWVDTKTCLAFIPCCTVIGQ